MRVASLIFALATLAALPHAAAASVRTIAEAPAAFSLNASYTYLYVTDPKVNQLEVLDPSYNLVKTYTGLNTPVGDYVDPKGNLYVANEGTCAGTGNVVEYAHGSASPTYTYSAGLNCPLYAVADANGHVFVYDYAGALTSNVVEYRQKTNTVLATWNTCNTGTYAFCYPTGLTIDASGHVFATLYGAVHGSLSYYWTVDDVYYKLKNVQAYVTGYTGPAGGVAVDKHRNILVSANSVPSSGSAGKVPSGSWGIVEQHYPYGGSDNAPVDLNYFGFTFVSELALSADQKSLFVADYGGATLTVLTYPNGNFVTALGIANGLTDPDGVALGPSP